MALFWDHPEELVLEENFWTLWCKGRLTKADTPTKYKFFTNYSTTMIYENILSLLV